MERSGLVACGQESRGRGNTTGVGNLVEVVIIRTGELDGSCWR